MINTVFTGKGPCLPKRNGDAAISVFPRMKKPFINVTIPVYNEETSLAKSVGKVARFLATNCPYPCEIVIADNASTDQTWHIARQLQARNKRVRVVHLDEKGRGRAVKKVWRESAADIL